MAVDASISKDAQAAEGSATKAKRLHLSGLNVQQCSVDDIKARLSSFGLAVSEQVYNWPPQQNAVGLPTNWCFADVRGTEGQIQRALTILNGTLWKGSKLRIGYAKKMPFKSTSTVQDDSVDDTATSKEKKQKQKRSRSSATESQDIQTPITAKQLDQDNAPWGWKKTPAGHLIRPLHMRPDRPIAKPSIAASDANTSDLKRKSKREQQQRQPKPLVRAKRITIDPLRYNAVHLSGNILEGTNAERMPDGSEWSFEDADDTQDDLLTGWVLRDKHGDVIKDERVKLEQMPTNVNARQEEAEDEWIGEDEYDEVDAAIDRAIDSDSDIEAKDDLDKEHSPTEIASPSTPEDQTEEGQEIVFPHYDPDEEDAFSEGYQEVADPTSSANTLDWAGEKTDQLELLKRMFGAKGLQKGKDAEDVLDAGLSMDIDDDTEDEQTDFVAQPQESKVAAAAVPTGVARRAALLNMLQPDKSKKTNQFQPILRYNPATTETEDAEDMNEEQVAEENAKEQIDEEETQVQQQPTFNKIPSAEQPRDADRVEMHTLTDMFRPKEIKGGFSLLAGLDLDLDDELNFEPDADEFDQATAHAENNDVPYRLDGYDDVEQRSASYAAKSTGEAATYPLFFPRLTQDGQTVSDKGRDVFSMLARELEQNEAMKQFFTHEDADTLGRKWQERKATLTQEYKRRHREALKKKKRRVTGSRAAGTAPMLGRPVRS